LHTTHIAPAHRSRVFVTFTVAQPLWGFATTAVKISIIHLYMTMFPGLRFRRVCYATMVLALCYFVSVIVETLAMCKPVQFNWDKTIKGHCIKNAPTAYIVAAVSNLLIDVIIVAMPVPVLWSLRMKTKKKIGIVAIFSLGAM
jgi:hypothetical protein